MNAQQVLIIEDDKDAAGLFKTVLELVGFDCEVVLSAKGALDRLAVSAPDVILLDIRLGIEISGEDILYQIRSNPRFDKTRVVIVTAYPRLAEPIANLADIILLKPIDISQLKNLMQRLGSLDYISKFPVYRDPITELFNEEFFMTRLQLAFERAKRRKDFHFGIIAIEFQLEPEQEEQIKPDTLTAILREIAGRLKKFIRPTDLAARLAGWKFVTLHEDLNKTEEIELIAKRLGEKLSGPYEIKQNSYRLRVDLLPVIHGPQYQQPGELLKAALKTISKQPARE
jgi:diguanylate cyclase (GGDEF)-like protein